MWNIICYTLLVLFVDSISPGDALQCFSCSSTRTTNAINNNNINNNNNNNLNPINAGNNNPQMTASQMACEAPLLSGAGSVDTEFCSRNIDAVCAIYVTKSASAETLIRGCRDRSICETLRKQSNDFNYLKSCRTCSHNLCDAASTNATPPIMVLLLLPLITYYLLYRSDSM